MVDFQSTDVDVVDESTVNLETMAEGVEEAEYDDEHTLCELFPAPFITGSFVLTAKEDRDVKELLTGEDKTKLPTPQNGGTTTTTTTTTNTSTSNDKTYYFLNYVHIHEERANYIQDMADKGTGMLGDLPPPFIPCCTGDVEIQVFVPNDSVPKMFANVGRLIFNCTVAQRNRILQAGHFTLEHVKSKAVMVAFYPKHVVMRKMMMLTSSPDERVRELAIFSPKSEKHEFPIKTNMSVCLHYIKQGGCVLNSDKLLNNLAIWKKQLAKRLGQPMTFSHGVDEGATRLLEDKEVDHVFVHCMGRISKNRRLPPPQVYSLILNHRTNIHSPQQQALSFPFPTHRLTEEVAHSVVRQHETETLVAKTFTKDVVQPICKARRSMVNLAFYISERTIKATMDMIEVVKKNFTSELMNGAAWWGDENVGRVRKTLHLMKEQAFENILNVDKLLEPVTKDAKVVYSEQPDHFLELYGNAHHHPLVQGGDHVVCEVVDLPRMEADHVPLLSQALEHDQKWKTDQGKRENAADNNKRMKHMMKQAKRRKKHRQRYAEQEMHYYYSQEEDERSRKEAPHRDAHTTFPISLYETKQKERVRLSKPSQRVRFSSEHGYPMWAEPKVSRGEQVGYKFRQILPKVMADYIKCVDKSVDDEEGSTTTMDHLLQTRAACVDGGRCNEVFMQSMHVSTFILDVDIHDPFTPNVRDPGNSVSNLSLSPSL